MQDNNVNVSGCPDQTEHNNNRTSRKQLPKMSSLLGPLREVVTYETSDHIGSKFCLTNIWCKKSVLTFCNYVYVRNLTLAMIGLVQGYYSPILHTG